MDSFGHSTRVRRSALKRRRMHEDVVHRDDLAKHEQSFKDFVKSELHATLSAREKKTPTPIDITRDILPSVKHHAEERAANVEKVLRHALDGHVTDVKRRFAEHETSLKAFVKSELQATMSAHENKVRSATPKILETNVEKVLRHALDEHVKDVKRRFVEHETSLKAFVKSELQATMSAHERKVPSNLLETLPLVGSSGNFNFHDKLIRKVGPGTNSSDVVIKAQLDGTLAEAKKHADSLFHTHKELAKNDYSILETKIENLEKVNSKNEESMENLEKRVENDVQALRKQIFDNRHILEGLLM